MTKQEEIREGTREAIKQAIHLNTEEFGGISVQFADCYLDEAVASVLFYLHDNDVMIKVKCPDCEWSQFGDEVVGMTPCFSCNSTGYIFEPLIGVEDG
ncbi:unnamed protein product [marine sediment metagenome]|uniref:Uncharacterized protein n=1 Tax=marine sediment metagenome TaxID=412755 RepID=X1GCZ1_9ZZZZ